MTYPSTARILALDIGTQCGYAQLANGIVTSGTIGFHRYTGSKSKAAEHVGQPYLTMHKWLRARLTEDKPDCIVFEEVFRWMSADAARTFGAYRGQILLLGAYYGLPCRGYPLTEVKKFWTGSGVAKKPQMIAECLKRFPHLSADDVDDNQVDAIALLHLHLSHGKADSRPS
jgi:Holliday junction resolvasome RuvABC endonuclease subunit